MPPMQFERRELGRYIAAAVRVLAAAGRPLTAGEIADEAVACGLIRPDGRVTRRGNVLDAHASRIRRPGCARRQLDVGRAF